uniref:Uncharacterized protein n=1 Tax=Physcomitrium patens TaxID=3218 RepID=A0A2K1ICK1_PHYPA|nr:hypothetical protein PHYPA_030478 [Physcomitrium patens]
MEGRGGTRIVRGRETQHLLICLTTGGVSLRSSSPNSSRDHSWNGTSTFLSPISTQIHQPWRGPTNQRKITCPVLTPFSLPSPLKSSLHNFHLLKSTSKTKTHE